MNHDRLDVFTVRKVAAWKTPYKKAVLWLYERSIINAWLTFHLIRIARAELA